VEIVGVQVTLTVPDELYRQAEAVAKATNQAVAEVLVESIRLDWHTTIDDASWPPLPDDEEHQEMAREEAAYRAIHAELYARFPGQYVAVYQGQLVDHDTDANALFERIDKDYPDEIVLMTQVREAPEQEFTILSPRLEV
jgi:hypothetical protein